MFIFKLYFIIMFSKYKNISNASLIILKNLYFYTYIKLSSDFYTFEVIYICA